MACCVFLVRLGAGREQAECKAALQRELGLAERPDVPLIGFIGAGLAEGARRHPGRAAGASDGRRALREHTSEPHQHLPPARIMSAPATCGGSLEERRHIISCSASTCLPPQCPSQSPKPNTTATIGLPGSVCAGDAWAAGSRSWSRGWRGPRASTRTSSADGWASACRWRIALLLGERARAPVAWSQLQHSCWPFLSLLIFRQWRNHGCIVSWGAPLRACVLVTGLQSPCPPHSLSSFPCSHSDPSSCDILLMPSRLSRAGSTSLYAMRYGTIPVVHATGGLRDTVEDFNPFANGGAGAGTG